MMSDEWQLVIFFIVVGACGGFTFPRCTGGGGSPSPSPTQTP